MGRLPQPRPAASIDPSPSWCVPPLIVRDTTREYQRAARSVVRPTDVVLEIGSAAGITTNMLSRLCRECVGVDMSEIEIEGARARFPNLEFHRVDGRDISTLQQLRPKFDIVCIDIGGRAKAESVVGVVEAVARNLKPRVVVVKNIRLHSLFCQVQRGESEVGVVDPGEAGTASGAQDDHDGDDHDADADAGANDRSPSAQHQLQPQAVASARVPSAQAKLQRAMAAALRVCERVEKHLTENGGEGVEIVRILAHEGETQGTKAWVVPPREAASRWQAALRSSASLRTLAPAPARCHMVTCSASSCSSASSAPKIMCVLLPLGSSLPTVPHHADLPWTQQHQRGDQDQQTLHQGGGVRAAMRSEFGGDVSDVYMRFPGLMALVAAVPSLPQSSQTCFVALAKNSNTTAECPLGWGGEGARCAVEIGLGVYVVVTESRLVEMVGGAVACLD